MKKSRRKFSSPFKARPKFAFLISMHSEILRRPYLAILAFVVFGCNNPTQQELRIIKKLNDKYPDYTFEPGSGPVGIYLNLHMRKPTWDTLTLKMLYDSSVVTHKKLEGIPWVYLAVFNSSGEYLFTIVRQPDDKYAFFKEE